MLLAFSLCTTIGYGYITPNSDPGKASATVRQTMLRNNVITN
jgi:hypothetical protein